MQTERPATSQKISAKAWTKPVIENLGSVTEITLRGDNMTKDRKQFGGNFVCCCAT